jgi:hypothetical protein
MLTSPVLSNAAFATGDITKAIQSPATKPAAQESATTTASTDAVRLTKTIKPSAYQLTFEPDLKEFIYTGKEVIDINVAEPSKEITLHSIDLNFTQKIRQSRSRSKKRTSTHHFQ